MIATYRAAKSEEATPMPEEIREHKIDRTGVCQICGDRLPHPIEACGERLSLKDALPPAPPAAGWQPEALTMALWQALCEIPDVTDSPDSDPGVVPITLDELRLAVERVLDEDAPQLAGLQFIDRLRAAWTYADQNDDGMHLFVEVKLILDAFPPAPEGSPAKPELFETICSRCGEPHMVDGDTLVGALCPKCQTLSVYGTDIPAAPQPVPNLMDALRKGLENALKSEADASPAKETR